jgi:hypothetical protein
MRKRVFVFLFSLFLLFLSVQSSFAAGATIVLSPQSGSFGKAFRIDLVIDGQGDKFNAAQSNVDLSSNLKVDDLVLGDCNFSFLHTPTGQNPSFAGVMLSTYATKCTAYSLTVVPVEKGKGTITLSKGSVRRYGDAKEILSSAGIGTYTLTGIGKVTGDANVNVSGAPKDNSYSVIFKVISAENTPIQGDTVQLSSVGKKSEKSATTDSSGKVQFRGLKSGVYDATVLSNGRKVGETIINLSGANHVVELGINLGMQKNNPLMKDTQSFLAKLTASPVMMGGVLVLGILLGIVIAVVVVKLSGKKAK